MFVYAFGFNGFKQLKNTSKEHNSSIIWRKTSICHANNALQLYAKEGKFYSHCSSWESFIFLKGGQIVTITGTEITKLYYLYFVYLLQVSDYRY